MRRHFVRLAQILGFARSPDARVASAERPLRLLLVASVVLPIAVFAIAAAISHQQHFQWARDRQQVNLGRISEHALKVFETFELSAIYLDEMLSTVTDEEIRENEADYSKRLGVITSKLMQLRDLWIIDGQGYPVVSATVFPMPKIDLSDREYFRVHRDNQVQGLHISEVLEARAANLKFFAVSRRRDIDGQFAGVTIVSIAPEYFVDYYSRLPEDESSSAALLRADGALLARHPAPSLGITRARPDGPFMRAIQASADRGTFTAISDFDRLERTTAYRLLPRYGVYVTTTFANDTVRRAWIKDMASHLVFGIPATMAVFAAGFMALRRTQRLEQEVQRREATEHALRQSQKMEAVGQLSGGIAHDFNNMLTVILGNIDMAIQRLGSEHERITRPLAAARQASARAAALVQRLLAFSRQHPMEIRSVDINRLVQNMSELLRRTIGEKVRIETVLAGGLWRAAIDPNQLENAIVNLAVNARDAMPDGGRLTIETANAYLDEAYVAAAGTDVAKGQYVMLAVSDTGTGMNRQTMERAFEPFFTTKPTGMGTGLGLSMVYGFAKQSKGHIRIYSELGEGTTIKLYFPRLTDAQGIPAWPDDSQPEQQNAPRPGGNEKILLVEDDEEVNRFTSDTLREQGYRVLTASDGPSAIAMFDSDPEIALLFTDVVLPGSMNGRQIADTLRGKRASLKVIYATGYTRNAIIHQGRLDPDVELLTKPFSAEAMLRKVRQILDGKG